MSGLKIIMFLLIYAAFVAGEETLYTHAYVQSHIRHTSE